MEILTIINTVLLVLIGSWIIDLDITLEKYEETQGQILKRIEDIERHLWEELL